MKIKCYLKLSRFCPLGRTGQSLQMDSARIQIIKCGMRKEFVYQEDIKILTPLVKQCKFTLKFITQDIKGDINKYLYLDKLCQYQNNFI